MRFHLVDAFADQAFSGNTAGVVLLDAPAGERWMQDVAAEFKHPETAFVVTSGEGPAPLRWFTPTVEVALCGHATLATAHVLGGEQTFSTLSGELRCRAEDGWVTLDFPADPPAPVAGAEQDRVARALGGLPVEYLGRGEHDLLAVLRGGADVRGLQPDLDAIADLGPRALIVTAPGDRDGIDMVSRVFGPAVGIDEDPVTGSAHCTLAPYWARRSGRGELVGEQASARGGIVRMDLRGDRVLLAGRAITVASGELHV
ncbi:oxidoreductase [Amycolatopsis antarctica]|uniref:Oxidoreductase n=1 Tax=Amycolatopsis antarctica TaxID=1854586 RepID=A0A263CWX5_9PSEU|nr:PhzF family phenazine biosynthesis protein [Amycolatopsis antarctica]OZM70644.1 oxidoreductase [Amycolatopsis antarctica]